MVKSFKTRKFAIAFLAFVNAVFATAQERIMQVHFNNGTIHSYLFSDIDSISFIELETVMDPIEAGAEMMPGEMTASETCHDYFSLTDHYLFAKNKDIPERIFGSSVAGQYALMPVDKNVMVKLYGGGKYLVKKYGTNHAEALYDENLHPVCGYSVDRGNATYVNNTMSYTIDLTDKEGIYYLRRFVRFAYADRMSIKVLEEFQPKGKTSYINLAGVSLNQLKKDGNSYIIPITKSLGRVSFDFTINEDCNIDAPDLGIAKIEMIDGTRNVSILRRQPEQLSIRYYGDSESITKADAQELKFRSGFIIGSDTIVRSADLYKPLAGKPCMYIWLKGQEFADEPTEDELLARSESLAAYKNYYVSLQNGQLSLYDGEIQIASVNLSGKTLAQLQSELTTTPAFKDFTVFVFPGEENLSAAELMSFTKIRLVGNYYQSYDLTYNDHVTEFQYHLDSYPLPLRQKTDASIHTFDAIMSHDGVYVGFDGHFRLIDYDLVRSISISSEGLSISNIDIEDGDMGEFRHRFTGVSRLSEPYVTTKRSPHLLGLMGHLVKADSPEGNVDYPASDVSSTRLDKVCSLLNTEGYKTLNMDELVAFMDDGMKAGKYAFFMFDDFRFREIWETESTRNIFISNGCKTNLAVIHKYLWNTSTSYFTSCLADIKPMKDMGWNCVSHSLRHNIPTGKKCSVALDYELRRIRTEAEEFGFNSEVFVYNWDGTWEPSDVLLQKNGFKYAINSRGTSTVRGTNPYRLGRTSFQEAQPFSVIESNIKW